MALVLLAACGEERQEPATPGERSPTTPASEPEAPADVEDPAADLAAAPAFDFRRVRTQPDAHEGRERVCDVAFADEAHPLEPTERALYPEPTETHRAIRCEASSGGGWLEVTFADPAEASEVVAGRRVVLTPAMAAGGRHGYVVARYVRTLGARPATIEGPGEGAPAAESGLGFDFGRLRNEPAQARAARMCVVDFVGEVELVDPRTRARVGYPAGTQNRLNVKCLHQGGDSWIDLVFDQTEADAALGVVPGAEIGVAIIAPSGGFADRPITRLAEET